MQLSEMDYAFVEQFRGLQVLREVVDRKPQRRSVYVGCPDCDQLKDVMLFHGINLGQKPHLAGAIQGGGARFHPKSTLNQGRTSFPAAWFLEEIKDAMMLKETTSVSVYSHAPCGFVYSRQVPLVLPELIELHFVGFGYLKEQLSYMGVKVDATPYFHVDYCGLRLKPKDKKTYELDRDRWLEVREQFWAEYLCRLPCRITELAA